ncbi:chitobiase/beta-hexosaminidase C-terminal domain-containing protein [Maribacter ulvicola]|uniref:Chitobiase/beta-hexosaminidase C-terminal domain-containing protein n=1 Tax=Maribacter ulvicola TaxID=228959 RepID=A0A1N6QL70_9FLAO|nr:chitobiase/beta-hexosaminidase C-terminal domain-containing protein [Maribacter ulvicola]SIQ17371.1 Chitobiase/beta-hexosaminidase C-terminal domain-containing protein [Maribacter ulvicola]
MMKRTLYSIFAILMSCQAGFSQNTIYAPTEMFQLSNPRIQVSSIFFDSDITLNFGLDMPNSMIKYTLDGSSVNKNAKVFTEPFEITESAVIKAKMFHPDYMESDEVELEVIKIAQKNVIQQIEIIPAPSEKYSGMGTAGLIDLKKGSAQFGGDKQWLGYQTEKISASLQLKKNSVVNKIVVSALTNQSNWIFAPGKVEVFHGDKLVGKMTFAKSANESLNSATFLSVPINKDNYDALKVIIYPLSEIPQWHQGKGTIPWVFIDEIIIQ